MRNTKKFLYFLFRGSELVYIGITSQLANRIAEHRRKKEFDSYNVIDLSRTTPEDLELFFIGLLNPTYNEFGKSGDVLTNQFSPYPDGTVLRSPTQDPIIPPV